MGFLERLKEDGKLVWGVYSTMRPENAKELLKLVLGPLGYQLLKYDHEEHTVTFDMAASEKLLEIFFYHQDDASEFDLEAPPFPGDAKQPKAMGENSGLHRSLPLDHISMTCSTFEIKWAA